MKLPTRPLVALLAMAVALAASAQSFATELSCTSTREFVTTLEFLRKQKDLQLPDPDARKVAERVSEGCTGSGLRFIRVFQLLSRAGFGAKDCVEQASRLSARTDSVVETFVTVFQHAFLQEYLDLDPDAALKTALSLSSDFEGDVLAVRDDFRRLVGFCSDSGVASLGLPKPQCGAFAARVARKGQGFSGGIAEPFISTYQFLRSNPGPNLTAADALRVCEEIIGFGPGAGENFTQAYRYAVSKSGLGIGGADAIGFARRMATQTVVSAGSKH
jgi:hypothetical protein